MTITREQVEKVARVLSGLGYDDADAMLRDLWQRVEHDEAAVEANQALLREAITENEQLRQRVKELESACEGAMDHRTFGSQGADVIREAMEKRGWGGS